MKTYTYNGLFELERGGVLKNPEIAYHTYGDPANPAVWVCHALTASSEVAAWWPHTVCEGGFLDPAEHYVICANILGSCYGTTGPLSINPDTGKPRYGRFPDLTVRDWVRAHMLLADHLGVDKLTLVGASVGGFQAVEWAVAQPQRVERLILIGTDAAASAWCVAIDQTQRMAIEADPTYGEPSEKAGARGLAVARAIGLLTYRGPEGYARAQTAASASSYQVYQGEKLTNRYNAYSYYKILDAFDTHDVGFRRGGISAALSRITADTLVIGIENDLVFPESTQRRLAWQIPGAEYAVIRSAYGHDGFLIEHEQLNRLCKR